MSVMSRSQEHPVAHASSLRDIETVIRERAKPVSKPLPYGVSTADGPGVWRNVRVNNQHDLLIVRGHNRCPITPIRSLEVPAHNLHVLLRNTRSPRRFHPSWVTTS